MDRGIHVIHSRTVPMSLRGTWATFRLSLDPHDRRTRVALAFMDEAGKRLPGSRRLRHVPGGVRGPCFVPEEAVSVRVEAIGRTEAMHVRDMDMRAVARWRAALDLIRESPRRLAPVFSRPFSPRALMSRFRAALALEPMGSNDMSTGYPAWVALFDTWAPEDLAPDPGAPSVGFLLLAGAGERVDASGFFGRLFSPVPHAIAAASDWREAASRLATDYVGILGPDDLLSPWSAALATRELGRVGRPSLALADLDHLDAAGVRRDPIFRPRPNRALMLSGSLTPGLWLIRRDVLMRYGRDTSSAETFRLSLWFAHYEATGDGGVRIPYILSHRHTGAAVTRPEGLAAVCGDHLGRTGLPFEVEASTPLRLTILSTAVSRPVTALVPSTLRRDHARLCIRAILEGTDHPDFRMEVGISQPGPLDEEQRRVAAEIEAYPHAKVTWLPAPRFNFAWVNNRLAEHCAGRDVLLLNDDVSPLEPDWLRRMGAWLADDRVGAVGVRLLYPSGRVQHGGIIMGLAGLCEHAHRNQPREASGYTDRAVLPQELSAVTAACLLVRHAAYDLVGGLDEAFPSAFNDVDLCLRIGQGGFSVLYDGAVSLLHRELQTYGHHYAGERAAFQVQEVALMHARWADVIADDPFHNPNLSLDPGREWQLAFPPRVPGRSPFPRGKRAEPDTDTRRQ